MKRWFALVPMLAVLAAGSLWAYSEAQGGHQVRFVLAMVATAVLFTVTNEVGKEHQS